MNHQTCANPECGCCEGTSVLIPFETANRPGLHALATRIGTHGSFLETMKAKLASAQHRALRGLTTRAASDPSIALLDAWATVADVLTFYTERFVNEGYLRTATERRSLVELARLVGYRPRPGVASSVFLSFTLDEGAVAEIPAGQTANSVPGPGEKRQTFETLHALTARAPLNRLRPRRTIPQEITPENVMNLDAVFLAGINLGLKANDLLLFVARDDPESRWLRRVASDIPEFAESRTRVELQLEVLSSPHFVEEVTSAAVELKAKTSFSFDTTTPPRNSVRDLVNVADPLLAKLNAAQPLTTLDTTVRVDLTTRALPLTGKTFEVLSNEIRLEATLAKEINKGLGEFFGAELKFRQELAAELNGFKNDGALVNGLLGLFPILDPTIQIMRAFLLSLAAMADSFATGLGSATLKQLAQKMATDWKRDAQDASITNPGALLANAITVRTTFETAVTLTGPLQIELGKVLVEIDGCLSVPQSAPINSVLDRIFNTAATDSLQAFSATTTGLLQTRIQEILTAIKSSFGKLVVVLKAVVWPTPATANDVTLSTQVTKIVQARIRLNPLNTAVPTLPADALVVATALGDVRDEQTAALGVSDGFIEVDRAADALEAQLTEIKEELVRKGTAFVQRYAALDRLTGDDATTGSAVFAALDALARGLPMTGIETAGRELRRRSMTELSAELDAPLRTVRENLGKGSPTLRLTLRRLFGELRSLKLQIEQQPTQIEASTALSVRGGEGGLTNLLEEFLESRPSKPGDPLRVTRELTELFAADERKASDVVARVASAINRTSNEGLFDAWRKIRSGKPQMLVYVFRQQAAVFGNNASIGFPILDANQKADPNLRFAKPEGGPDWTPLRDDLAATIFLDGENPKILSPGYVVVQRLNEEPEIFGIKSVSSAPRTAYGLSAKSTAIKLDEGSDWGHTGPGPADFMLIRTTVIHAQSEALALAEKPVSRDVGLARPQPTAPSARFSATASSEDQTATNPLDEDDRTIMLDGLFEGLEPGRWLLFAGERTGGVSGALFKELALIQSVDHVLLPSQRNPQAPLPGDTPHTRVVLAAGLTFSPFKRETVQIHGNVVEATHGETQRETLGNGDARTPYQSFELKQSPLTFVAAPTVGGAESTLGVRVNAVLWHETESFNTTGPTDREFVTETSEEEKTRVIFGDGRQGARLPTGFGNVQAVYRSGIGKAGNVKAGAISQLPSKPLGLKEVLNPLGATGGSNRDTSEQVRRNAPLITLALDRLVAVRDYADFARTFAGIAKSSATMLAGGGGRFVHLTIAGVDDIPIDESSQLFRNLTRAIENAGDPSLRFQMELREQVLLVLVARVRVLPDYLWEKVEPQVRAALLLAFGFERRALGEDVMLSELRSVIQAVDGVDYVDVDSFGGVPEKITKPAEPTANPPKPVRREPLEPREIAARIEVIGDQANTMPDEFVAAELAGFDDADLLHPAQIAVFSAAVSDTLILKEIQ